MGFKPMTSAMLVHCPSIHLSTFLSLIILIIIQNEAMWIIFMSFKLKTVIQNFQVPKRAIINDLLPTFCFNLMTLKC